MLTIKHPEILAAVAKYPMGLMPIRNETEDRWLLVVKCPKEYILAAKQDGGITFYLLPVISSSGPTCGLITAFFDDVDQPLVLSTPFFADDEMTDHLLVMLASDGFGIHFFDEHNREYLSYRAVLHDGGSLLGELGSFCFLGFHENTIPEFHYALRQAFGMRTEEDDSRAIRADFAETLQPDGLVFLDGVYHDYQGGRVGHAQLVQENPGYYQERDIALALRRAFRPDQILINPHRRDTGKEFVDVLVVTDEWLLLVQGKDSPNTEDSLNRSLDRKRSISHSQLSKGVAQVKGALAYAASVAALELRVADKPMAIALDHRRLLGLVVIKEVFSDERNAVFMAASAVEEADRVCIAMDYPTLHAFTHCFGAEDALIGGLLAFRQEQTRSSGTIDARDFVHRHVIERMPVD